MAKISAEISYDKEEDILNISRNKGSLASIEIGDFILDIDSNGFVSSIEILNASENLGINKEFLNSIETGKIAVLYKPNYLFIGISLNIKGIEKEIRIPLSVDLGHKQIEKQEFVFAR